MDLQSILAALLNPNGTQQAQPIGMATPVGDHAGAVQQRLGGMPPQMQPPQMAQQAPQQALPPQGQPMPQPTPQAPQQSQGGGLGAIGGILQNIIAPQSAQKNKTVGWLTSQGLDRGTATVLASDKTALRQYIMSRSQGQKPIEINGRIVDPVDYHVIADFSDKKEPDKTRTLSEQEVAALKLTPGSYQMDSGGKITSIGGVREQDPTFGREKDLRQEYEGLPPVKTYQIVRDNYERIRQGAQLTTGAGDLAIVFGYMKMLDPTSVVREGEQASAQNTAGVPAAIRNTYNSIMSGDKLSPEARQQLLSAAQQVYTEASKNLSDINQRYSGIAGNYQLDPARIVQMPESYDPIAIPPQQGGDLPLPPASPSPAEPAPMAPPVAPSPAPAAPKGVIDWKDYFGKKAR